MEDPGVSVLSPFCLLDTGNDDTRIALSNTLGMGELCLELKIKFFWLKVVHFISLANTITYFLEGSYLLSYLSIIGIC